MPGTPLEAYPFDAHFGKRSVCILDPRLRGVHKARIDMYSDKHSNLFPHVCPLWNFDLLEQSVIFIFLPLSSVQSRPRFCIIDTDIFYSDAK